MRIKIDPIGIQSKEQARSEYIVDRLEGCKGRRIHWPAIIVLRKTRKINTIVISYENDSPITSICLNYGGKYTDEYFVAHRFTVSFKEYPNSRTYDYFPKRTLRKILIWPSGDTVTLTNPILFYNKRKKISERWPLDQILTVNPKYIKTFGTDNYLRWDY